MLSLAKATILWSRSVKIHRYMTCGVVATSISGCDVCTVCRVVCDYFLTQQFVLCEVGKGIYIEYLQTIQCLNAN